MLKLKMVLLMTILIIMSVAVAVDIHENNSKLRELIKSRAAEKSEDIHCTVIHKPKKGCPPGWSEDRDVFKEKDGSKQSACHAPEDSTLPGCFDYLNPGESIELHLHIPVPPNPDPHT